MSDHFVKDTLEAVKVGDVMEFRIVSLDAQRRRIGLSRKSGVGGEVRKQSGSPTRSNHKQHSPATSPQSPAPVPRKDDDGTMYNPFAEAFKKAGKK